MKIKLTTFCFGLLALGTGSLTAAPLGTAFNYQGRLEQNGQPATNWVYSMKFALYDAASGGTFLGTNLLAVPVTNGLFNATLDYSIMPFLFGDASWLEIGVSPDRVSPSPAYTTLAPRTRLNPTPAANWANVAGLARSVTNGAVGADGLRTPAAPIAGQVLTYDGLTLTWQPVAGIAGAWATNGNNAAVGSFLGTVNNQPLDMRANNIRVLRLDGNLNAPNVIAGASGNHIAAGNEGATIAGGGTQQRLGGVYTNRIEAYAGYATIGGGLGNVIRNDSWESTIAGGNQNVIHSNSFRSIIGGGFRNFVGTNCNTSTIGGGTGNSAGNNAAFVGGGAGNKANGSSSALAGGYNNLAGGGVSFVGGGENNRAAGSWSVVGGGNNNLASGVSATVAGGEGSQATGNRASIIGGYGNVGSGEESFIGGGSGNSAEGVGAVALGGFLNIAQGADSFAAGVKAFALHDNSFVWADYQEDPRFPTPTSFESTGPNQFCIRARGGVRLNTDTSMYFGNQARQMLNLWGSGYGIGVQTGVLYQRTAGAYAWYKSGTHSDSYGDPGPGGRALMSLDDNFLNVRGAGNEQAYIGGDGLGNDIQVGSLNPTVTDIYMYNGANGTLMHTHVGCLTIHGGCDLAEPFPMEEKIEKGSVVIIDEEHPGQLKLSTRAYDTQVAGIVSGANGINPGIALKQEGALDQGQNVALSGRVYVKADASYGAIKPGDLLTTSDTPGHAMKVSDHTKSQGAILGKAMGTLKEGTGLVLVLVTLQ